MEPKTISIPLYQIDEPPEAMRTHIDRDAVFELLHDIQKNGLINPITVRPKGERYEIVAGHRRFLAHRFGGIMAIRCIVRELDDDAAFGIMTSENLARENVNPVDEAIHTMRLLDHHKGDIEKVRSIMNRSAEWIENRVIIAQMFPDLQGALREGKVKIGAALALTKITDETDQRACLSMAISQGASVPVVNYWVAQWHAGLFGHANSVTVPDSNMPGQERQVITLKCAIDGKDYPCEDFVSIMVARKNLGYVQAINEHLNQSAAEAAALDVEREALDEADEGEGIDDSESSRPGNALRMRSEAEDAMQG